jgi:hypothetical protein
MQTPRDLSEEKTRLSYDCAKLMERLSEIKVIKRTKWFEIRKNVKSDKQADIEWDATELGIEEMVIGDKIRAKKMKISAINTEINIAILETKNQF